MFVLFALVSVYALPSAGQVILLAPDRVVAASGSAVLLDVRCEQIPTSLAAALTIEVSTPALLPPDPVANTVTGLRPTVQVRDASHTMILHFASATGSGLTELKSRIQLLVGDDTVPAEIRVLELRYVAVPGPSVATLPVNGLRITINEDREAEPETPTE